MDAELSLVCSKGNKRPSMTEAMRLKAAEVIADRLIRGYIFHEEEREDITKDIAEASKFMSRCDDGYILAKRLDDTRYWCCDIQIAEILDRYGAELDIIYDKEEEKWAQENPREPKYKEGDVVLCRNEKLTILGNYDHRPQCYKVRLSESTPGDKSFRIIPWEEIDD